MTNCPLETRENAHLLLDYCARKLDPESLAVLERHIAVCSACRNFTRGQRTVWQAMDAWEAAPVSRDFDRRLYRRIETQVSWWDLLLRPFTTATLRRGLPAAAMTCLLLVAGILLERPAVSPPAATTGGRRRAWRKWTRCSPSRWSAHWMPWKSWISSAGTYARKGPAQSFSP